MGVTPMVGETRQPHRGLIRQGRRAARCGWLATTAERPGPKLGRAHEERVAPSNAVKVVHRGPGPGGKNGGVATRREV